MPKVSTLLKLIEESFVVFLNASLPIFVILVALTVTRLESPLKAESPILVTFSPKLTVVKEVQLAKQDVGNEDKILDKLVTVLKRAQFSKAESPTYETLLGIVISF